MFKKLFSNRVARQKWDAGLIWFRLRYLNAETVTRCLNLLSRPQACGRVALYYRPGTAVSALYLGIPETHLRLLQRMMADFGFSLKPKPPDVAIPAARPLTAVANLPWDKPFVAPWMAHVVNESVFVDAKNNKHGSYLPHPPSAQPEPGSATWHLPNTPPVGLTTQPTWNGQHPPAHLVATEPNPQRWLLGRSRAGIPLHIAGQVNIYGRQEAVADWLIQQVMQMVALDYSNLVVIDGAGDLVPRLKRKVTVTRLLGEKLAYVDIDGASLAGGFNPLAVAPDEAEEETIRRWQRWFQGMNVHPQGIELLERAKADGVGDIPSLQKWLKRMARTGQYTAVSSLNNTLNRLTANRTLREWLEWPTNRFDILPEGALFFACKGSTWERRQLLRAALLVGLAMSETRLIIHGAFADKLERKQLPKHNQIVVSNGPLFTDGAIVLVESRAPNVASLTQRFLFNDSQLGENLALLGRGESIVQCGGNVVFTSWNAPD